MEAALRLAQAHTHTPAPVRGENWRTISDFTVAAALMNERMAMAATGLGHHAQRLLSAAIAAGVTTATMDDLARLLPDWTRYAFRTALDQLVALDHCSCSRTGQGKVRTYYIHARGDGNARANVTTSTIPRIGLRQLGDLAKLGETTFAKFIPDSDTG